MRIVLHAVGRRIVFRDDAPFEESKHPRAGNGQFGSGGGGSSSGGEATPHAKAVMSAINAPIKGSSAERVALRALLKDPNTKGTFKTNLQKKVLDSFAKHHSSLVKSNPVKAAEIAGKTAEHAKKYGMENPLAVKTVAQANSGYSPEVQKQAQAVMQAELPKPASGGFTPQETADFNDLCAVTDIENAKSWTAHAKKKVAQLGLNMSPGEAAHICAYTGNAYRKTNAQLRAGAMNEATWNHVNALNNALDKLPSRPGVTYRKTSLTPDQIALYQPGMIVTQFAFTSSSKSDAKWSGEHRFVIKGKNGKDVEPLSVNASEAEVLFKSGTQFKITKKDPNGWIHMEEVSGR